MCTDSIAAIPDGKNCSTQYIKSKMNIKSFWLVYLIYIIRKYNADENPNLHSPKKQKMEEGNLPVI